MTSSKDLSRRDFIKAGSTAAIGFMLLDNVLVEASTKASRPNILRRRSGAQQALRI